MVGILLLSHGRMAEGMIDSCKLFFGDDIPQLRAVCLHVGDTPEEYDEQIKKAIEEVDDGHGVIALVDLFGGTPSNRCSLLLNDNLQVITGMNLPVLLELLNMRIFADDLTNIKIQTLLDASKDGVIHLNEKMNAQEEEDSLF